MENCLAFIPRDSATDMPAAGSTAAPRPAASTGCSTPDEQASGSRRLQGALTSTWRSRAFWMQPSDQKLVLTIADDEGRPVRRIDLDGAAGLRRVAWNRGLIQ